MRRVEGNSSRLVFVAAEKVSKDSYPERVSKKSTRGTQATERDGVSLESPSLSMDLKLARRVHWAWRLARRGWGWAGR